jgi:hypothetical protein
MVQSFMQNGKKDNTRFIKELLSIHPKIDTKVISTKEEDMEEANIFSKMVNGSMPSFKTTNSSMSILHQSISD